MKEFKVSEFYDMVISILESILKEVVRENPDGKAIFPCIVAQAPMRVDEKMYQYYQDFQLLLRRGLKGSHLV